MATTRSTTTASPRSELDDPGQGPSPKRPTARRGVFWVLGVTLAIFTVHAWRLNWVNDDAFITFSYARSLVEGHGFTSHPSASPVEGFSELAWTLWVSIGILIGVEPALFARLSSLAAGALLILLVTQFAHRRDRLSLPALAVVGGFLALNPAFAAWSTSGMGTMPFTLALFVLYRALDDGSPRGPALCAVATVWVATSRIDGAWWVFWIAGIAALYAPSRRSGRVAVMACAASLVALEAWRIWAFDDWLPNTARAKLGTGATGIRRGLDYIVHFGLTFPGVAVALAMGAGLAVRTRTQRSAMALGAIAATLVHAIVVGGDFMPFGRFLVPALPFIALMLGGSADRPGWRGVSIGALAALSLLLPSLDRHLTPESWRSAYRFRFSPSATGQDAPFLSELGQWNRNRSNVRRWSITGRDLARLAPEDASFVAPAVGALGWFSGLRVHDQHGLLSPEVARTSIAAGKRMPGHDRWVPPEVFEASKPTYYAVGACSLEWLHQSPDQHRWVVLGASEEPGWVLCVVPRPGSERATD